MAFVCMNLSFSKGQITSGVYCDNAVLMMS